MPDRTFEDMNQPGGNHIDRRRSLLPRDYVDPPHRFGLDSHIRVVAPPDGDAASREIAAVQHQLVHAWLHTEGRLPVSALARKFGFSKQVFSRVTLGQRWMGETVAAALIHAIAAARRDTHLRY